MIKSSKRANFIKENIIKLEYFNVSFCIHISDMTIQESIGKTLFNNICKHY